MSQPSKQTIILRLDRQQYKALVAKLPGTIINHSQPNDPVSVGYKLGVQHVLELLREGWVMESPS